MNGALAPKREELSRKSRITLAMASVSSFLSLVDRLRFALGRSFEELARPADLVLRIGDHLLPLRDPADGAREREDAGEHRHRDAEGALHDAGIEVDVGIELARDEIVVLERDLLQREGELKDAVVVQPKLVQHRSEERR